MWRRNPEVRWAQKAKLLWMREAAVAAARQLKEWLSVEEESPLDTIKQINYLTRAVRSPRVRENRWIAIVHLLLNNDIKFDDINFSMLHFHEIILILKFVSHYPHPNYSQEQLVHMRRKCIAGLYKTKLNFDQMCIIYDLEEGMNKLRIINRIIGDLLWHPVFSNTESEIFQDKNNLHLNNLIRQLARMYRYLYKSGGHSQLKSWLWSLLTILCNNNSLYERTLASELRDEAIESRGKVKREFETFIPTTHKVELLHRQYVQAVELIQKERITKSDFLQLFDIHCLFRRYAQNPESAKFVVWKYKSKEVTLLDASEKIQATVLAHVVKFGNESHFMTLARLHPESHLLRDFYKSDSAEFRNFEWGAQMLIHSTNHSIEQKPSFSAFLAYIRASIFSLDEQVSTIFNSIQQQPTQRKGLVRPSATILPSLNKTILTDKDISNIKEHIYRLKRWILMLDYLISFGENAFIAPLMDLRADMLGKLAWYIEHCKSYPEWKIFEKDFKNLRILYDANQTDVRSYERFLINKMLEDAERTNIHNLEYMLWINLNPEDYPKIFDEIKKFWPIRRARKLLLHSKKK